MKKSIISMFFCFCFLLSTISFQVSAIDKDIAEIEGYEIHINTYEQLKAHAANAQEDCIYILNDYIFQQDNLNDMEIVVYSGATFTLDLNGYTISRDTQGNDRALFRIKSGAEMTVKDSSSSKTGYCSFSEGYSSYRKAVFYNEGGRLNILNGYYEIFSPYSQGDCSVVYTNSGYTNIYDGTFDSSSAWGGDTITVGHDNYMIDTPCVAILGGDFYGKYQNIEASSYGNYLSYGEDYPNGALHPIVYVLGGNFYVTNGGKDGEQASFAYCNNGWGRVIVAGGTVLSKCLNSTDQRFLSGTSKKFITETIDDYTGVYYEVTAPPMIMEESLNYYHRLINLCNKELVKSYSDSVYEIYKETFDNIMNNIDVIYVSETEKNSPEIRLDNRIADHQYINWYICDSENYCGANTSWTHLGNFQNVSWWQFEERPKEGGGYIIRCVVTNSDLSTYEDLVALYYEPLKSDEVVSSIEIQGLEIPVAGEKADFSVAPEESFYINAVFWTDITDPKNKMILNENDTFIAGHTYELEIWIRANEYYKFRTDSDGWIDIDAVVGTNEAEVILPGSSISAELLISFTVEDSDIVTNPVSTDSSDSTDPSSPDNPIGLLGDADVDSKVNVKDATAIQKHLASIIMLSETGLKLADADSSGNVNIKDATAIQKWVAGIETGYPIGETKTK